MHAFPHSCSMLLHLPSDVWECIDAFLQCDVLSQVCRRLWQLFERRYLRVKCQSQKELRRATASGSRARTLHLHVEYWATDSATVVDLLWAWLRSRSSGDSFAWDLAVLKDATSLEFLMLHLQNLLIGRSGARALAALKNVPSLHTLVLDLRRNSIGDAGAQALAALKDSTSLHTLVLDLWRNSIGDAGAQALAALKDSTSLRYLELYLSFNSIGPTGAQALAALKDAPSLTNLHLDLNWNSIGPSGAQALATLRDAPSLHTLWLHLRANSIGATGAQALASLKDAPSLSTLHLDLYQNGIEDDLSLGNCLLAFDKPWVVPCSVMECTRKFQELTRKLRELTPEDTWTVATGLSSSKSDVVKLLSHTYTAHSACVAVRKTVGVQSDHPTSCVYYEKACRQAWGALGPLDWSPAGRGVVEKDRGHDPRLRDPNAVQANQRTHMRGMCMALCEDRVPW